MTQKETVFSKNTKFAELITDDCRLLQFQLAQTNNKT